MIVKIESRNLEAKPHDRFQRDLGCCIARLMGSNGTPNQTRCGSARMTW